MTRVVKGEFMFAIYIIIAYILYIYIFAPLIAFFGSLFIDFLDYRKEKKEGI